MIVNGGVAESDLVAGLDCGMVPNMRGGLENRSLHANRHRHGAGHLVNGCYHNCFHAFPEPNP
jgi:hypothetical protein